MELVIGFSDRRVQSYRWQNADRSASNDTDKQPVSGKFVMLESWQLAGQVGSTWYWHYYISLCTFKATQRYLQMSSMTVHKRADGSIDLMVSQPGGAYVTLLGSESRTGGAGSTALTHQPLLTSHGSSCDDQLRFQYVHFV